MEPNKDDVSNFIGGNKRAKLEKSIRDKKLFNPSVNKAARDDKLLTKQKRVREAVSEHLKGHSVDEPIARVQQMPLSEIAKLKEGGKIKTREQKFWGNDGIAKSYLPKYRNEVKEGHGHVLFKTKGKLNNTRDISNHKAGQKITDKDKHFNIDKVEKVERKAHPYDKDQSPMVHHVVHLSEVSKEDLSKMTKAEKLKLIKTALGVGGVSAVTNRETKPEQK